MRSGSLVGPFLLIAIGVLILIHNLGYDLSLLDLAAIYWPFILIAWGALRLVEILAIAIRSQPLPRAGVTGGEWALVILISLVGMGTNIAREQWPRTRITMHGLEVFGEAFDFPVSGQIAAGETPRVIVENLTGNVRIVGNDTTDVKVEGRTTVRAFDAADAEKANAQCPLQVVEQGGQVIVRTNHSQVTGSARVTTDLEIVVPKGASITGRGRRGDFDVANIAGNVGIESENAGVRLTAIGNDARVDLGRSDIIRMVNVGGSVGILGRGRDIEIEEVAGLVTINGSYSGELRMRELAQPLVFESKRTEFRVQRTPGMIRMALGDLSAENLVGPVTFKTESAFDVKMENFSDSLTLDIGRGDVELHPGGAKPGPIDVKLRSGEIDLTLAADADFGIDARTERGEAINEYGPELSVETTGERGATLSGPPGRQANIKLRTGRGDIIVRSSSRLVGEEEAREAPEVPGVQRH